MKAILISVQPQWVELILNLIKKDEIRKGTAIGKAITRLIKEQGVAPMFIYCTKDTSKGYLVEEKQYKDYSIKEYELESAEEIEGVTPQRILNGKVVARFNATVEEIICRPICGEWECYTKTQGYSEISKASCLKNKEIVHYLKGKNGTAIHINDLEIFDKPKEIREFEQCKCFNCKEKIKVCPLCFPKKTLTRAPQSWQYVEV